MKTFKKALACFLVVAVFLTAAPLSGFVGLQLPDLNLPEINFDNVFNKNAEAAATVDSGTCGENLTWTLDDAGTLTISGTEAMTDYTSSSHAPWYSNRSAIKKVDIEDGVTTIGDCAFQDCTSLTSVTIGDSVTSIGYRAFYGCTKLTSVTIPDSVTSIGNGAFYRCTSLTTVTIGDSVTSIGNYAFSSTAYYNDGNNWTDGVLYIGNHLIEAKKGISGSYAIKDGTKTIADDAFYERTSLTSVTIPDSVTSIGWYAFYWCTSLTAVHITDMAKWCNIDFGSYYANPLSFAHNLYLNGTLVTDLVIPNSVTEVKDSAFYGCTSLTSVTIPNSVTSIGSYAFWYCTSLTSVTIPDSVTSIGDYAFRYCSSLTSVTIPDSVTSIGKYAFYGCTSLTSVTIPNSVTSIGSYAFEGCTSLTAVTIPDSVTSIGEGAFNNCTSLTAITVAADNEYYSNDAYGALFNKDKTTLIQYPIGNERTSYTIPDSVTSIGISAFNDCTSLTSVTIPDSVTSIGKYAFYGCTSLTSVTIPDSMTSIEWNAFAGCESLTAVHITDMAKWCNIDFIDFFANPLHYAHNLYLNGTLVTDLVIPDSVTEVKDDAFRGCSMTSVTIPDSVTSIGYAAFSFCTSLTSVTIGDSVTSIGWETFYNCTSLTSVTIPDSVTSIGLSAFDDCASIASITILNPDCEIADAASTIYRGTTIYGYTGSTAEAYATKYNRTFVALDPHTHSYTSIVTLPATCCTTGVMTYTCECEDSYTEVIDFDFNNHAGGTEIRDAVDSTCSLEGYTGDTYCLGCNNKIANGDPITAPGHDYTSVVTAPTCEDGGYTTYTCTVCGDTYVADETDAIGHNYVGTVTLEPTCTDPGVKTYVCQNDPSHTFKEEIPAPGHTPDIDATCTTDQTCSVCGAMITPATGHNWDSGVVTVSPTCTTEGIRTFSCLRCTNKKTESVAIDPTSHTGATEIRNAVLATPTQAGYSGDKHCSACGAILEAGFVVTLGDMNADGKITPEDARLILRNAVELTEFDEKQTLMADIDGDGIITASDARLLLRATNGSEEWAYDLTDYEIMPEYSGASRFVTIETDWVIDEYNSIAVDVYLNECVDLTSYQLKFTYDADCFNFMSVAAGTDAKNVTLYCEFERNAIATEHNKNTDGTGHFGGYFKDSLWEADKFLENSNIDGDCIVNSERFHLATIYLQVENAYYCKGGSFSVTGNLTFETANGTAETSGTEDAIISMGGGHYYGWGNCPAGTKTCSYCGVTYTYYEGNHDWSVWTERIPATTTSEGEEFRTCQRCGEEETRVIDIIPEEPTEPPTEPCPPGNHWGGWGECRYGTRTCHYCGAKYNLYNEFHTWGYWTIRTPSTFDTAGEQVCFCDACNEETTRALPLLSEGLVIMENDFENAVIVDFFVKFSADGFAVVPVGTSVADLLNYTNGTAVLDKNGNMMSADSVLGTGMQLVLLDGETVIDSMEIAVLGDADGDGDLTAGDARIALRISVGLDNPEEVYLLAAKVNDMITVTAGDARLLLRASVGLENPRSWFDKF